jgi:hypothetical protein
MVIFKIFFSILIYCVITYVREYASVFRMYVVTDTAFGNSLQSKHETSSYEYVNFLSGCILTV